MDIDKELIKAKEYVAKLEQAQKEDWIEANFYLHSDKDDNLSHAEDRGVILSEEAAEKFMYALYEVEFHLKINRKTGEYQILWIKENDITFYPKVE